MIHEGAPGDTDPDPTSAWWQQQSRERAREIPAVLMIQQRGAWVKRGKEEKAHRERRTHAQSLQLQGSRQKLLFVCIHVGRTNMHCTQQQDNWLGPCVYTTAATSASRSCDDSVHATLKRMSVLVPSLSASFKASVAKEQPNFLCSLQFFLWHVWVFQMYFPSTLMRLIVLQD